MTDANVSSTTGHHPRGIAESFLQNVVVLDDLAFMSPPRETPTGPVVEPDYSDPPAASDDATDPSQRGVALDADAVINAFADIGSVCAVLHPAPGDEFTARTAKAAIRADIVVLDWKIHDSVGEAALSVMRDILRNDENSHRLRLIAVYTGEKDLNGIASCVKKVIGEFYQDNVLKTDGPFRMSKGPVRVVILAKHGTTDGRIPGLSEQEVAEPDLADRLVCEFVLMTSGLLRNVALAGIATIRNKAHKILGHFDETLDPAYLGHRLLLPHPPDAEDHLVAALGSELLSVLEDDRPGRHADIGAIERWLASRNDSGLNLSEPFPPQGETDAVDCWLDLLKRGIDGIDIQLPTKKGKLKKRGTEAFATDSNTAVRSNRRFAALLSLKTRYPGQDPRLTLGTILYTQGDSRRYLLCLQPKCDSIRLAGKSRFPLIPLHTVQVNNGTRRFRLVVETENDEWEHLDLTPKPSELIVPLFRPGDNPPGEVRATNESGKFYFKDTRGTRYRWIAEMKDEHAFRIAGEVASALARPGPNDAEWLRHASRQPR